MIILTFASILMLSQLWFLPADSYVISDSDRFSTRDVWRFSCNVSAGDIVNLMGAGFRGLKNTSRIIIVVCPISHSQRIFKQVSNYSGKVEKKLIIFKFQILQEHLLIELLFIFFSLNF